MKFVELVAACAEERKQNAEKLSEEQKIRAKYAENEISYSEMKRRIKAKCLPDHTYRNLAESMTDVAIDNKTMCLLLNARTGKKWSFNIIGKRLKANKYNFQHTRTLAFGFQPESAEETNAKPSKAFDFKTADENFRVLSNAETYSSDMAEKFGKALANLNWFEIVANSYSPNAAKKSDESWIFYATLVDNKPLFVVYPKFFAEAVVDATKDLEITPTAEKTNFGNSASINFDGGKV